jgi:hypothetical protein
MAPNYVQNGEVRYKYLPASACWLHQGLRLGFEVVYFRTQPSIVRIEGTTTGLQDGDVWVATYRLELDDSWKTRAAWISIGTVSDTYERVLESDGDGHWKIDGVASHELDGCLDIDLEWSAVTNALPVHRLGLRAGEQAAVPAAYVRLDGGRIERLEQIYALVDDGDGHQSYDYEAPQFDFRCQLVYDDSGLVVDYPGIAKRAG